MMIGCRLGSATRAHIFHLERTRDDDARNRSEEERAELNSRRPRAISIFTSGIQGGAFLGAVAYAATQPPVAIGMAVLLGTLAGVHLKISIWAKREQDLSG